MRTVIRIWHVIGEYQNKGTNTTVAFRVRTGEKNGKRTAIRYVKDSPQARLLKLRNIRTVGIGTEPCGIISWDAPKSVERTYHNLRVLENKEVRNWIAVRLKEGLKNRRKPLR